jgi:hypothetical protein
MPRRPRPKETQRSEHWLRVAVNDHQSRFDEHIRGAFGLDAADTIDWRSPIKSDAFAEYYDQEFLDRLDLNNLKVPLETFWPKSGPRWDGLAKTKSGKVILVEAKAYIEEAVDGGSGAKSPRSVEMIEVSLAAAKAAYRASKDANWETPLYQYANRLSHLYYLRRLNEVEAYLLFVYFAVACDVPNPCTRRQWEGAIRLTEKCLGLPARHPFRPYIARLIWSVPEMCSAETR